MLPKKYKTPLRYPGGKSRATKTLFEYFPDGKVERYYEPFIGGGSMAIEFTRRFPESMVTVSDLDPAVYSFWRTLRDYPVPLTDLLLESKRYCLEIGDHRKLFDESKEYLSDVDRENMKDTLKVAHAFFVVNKCGFSGLMAGGFSEQASHSNFSISNIKALPYYGAHIKNWRIFNADANSMILEADKVPNALVYLDPPYAKVGKDGKSFIYGKDGDMHKSFDHDRFCNSVLASKSNCLISYDNNELIREMYSCFKQETFDLTYTMHSGKAYREDEKKRKELVMWNYKKPGFRGLEVDLLVIDECL